MANVIRFPVGQEPRADDSVNADGRGAFKELIDVLQVMIDTQPSALKTIAKYAKFIVRGT